jgi:hypothetical protein
MIARATLVLFAVILFPSAAIAMSSDDRKEAMLVVSLVMTVVLGGGLLFGMYWTQQPTTQKPKERAWTPEDYDHDATLLRSKSRHAEAQAEYDEKLARMKLKAAELAEVEQFVASERAKVVNATASTKKQ